MTNREVRVLIADDHPIFRSGLAQLLRSRENIDLIDEVENGEVALKRIQDSAPDVVILDVDMPIKDGFAVARAIAEEQLRVGVIFLTMHKSEQLLNAALNLGAKGFILKESAMAEVCEAVGAVSAGGEFISPALSRYLINRRRRCDALGEALPTLKDLTTTELKVLRLVAESKSSKEIAAALGNSVRTIDSHRANIAGKLKLNGSHALLTFALDHKDELLSMQV
jgi:DNA-binding NarL/FixJ family response regulator